MYTARFVIVYKRILITCCAWRLMRDVTAALLLCISNAPPRLYIERRAWTLRHDTSHSPSTMYPLTLTTRAETSTFKPVTPILSKELFLTLKTGRHASNTTCDHHLSHYSSRLAGMQQARLVTITSHTTFSIFRDPTIFRNLLPEGIYLQPTAINEVSSATHSHSKSMQLRSVNKTIDKVDSPHCHLG